MKDFLIQTLIMTLGALLPVLLRAINQARMEFDAVFFVYDNRSRLILLFICVLVVSSLLWLEGFEILKALEPFGIAVPVLAKSVIGFAIASFVLAKSAGK